MAVTGGVIMTEQKYFLQGEKHVTTHGIDDRIDFLTQFLLWESIKEAGKRGLKLDYMQVFKLKTVRTRSKERLLLKVTHIQDDPPYENKFSIPIEPHEAVNGTVWVIDDLTHATMMWQEEY